MLAYERRWWAEGRGIVAGVDEAGRGPLAGPVIAAAVSLDSETAERLLRNDWKKLNDSKRLTDKLRRAFFVSITRSDAVMYGVGMCGPEEIDELNILRATHLAMRRAVEALPRRPDQVLVDGLPVKGLPVEAEAIVGGDGKSLLIAAASIVAKVTRDDLMIALDERHPAYGFARHKGYGTREHLDAIREYGPCPAHRKTFAPIKQMELF